MGWLCGGSTRVFNNATIGGGDLSIPVLTWIQHLVVEVLGPWDSNCRFRCVGNNNRGGGDLSLRVPVLTASEEWCVQGLSTGVHGVNKVGPGVSIATVEGGDLSISTRGYNTGGGC